MNVVPRGRGVAVMGINMTLDNELRHLRSILNDPKELAERKRLAKLRIEHILSFYDENA